jgi:hypothetical protein
MPGASVSQVGKAKPETGLYASPDDALKKLSSEFEYWSGKLTDNSVQMCYALIGANWVVFGSVAGILKNEWAKWSMLLVLFTLVINVLGALILSELHRKRIAYGEKNPARWAKEYQAAMHTDDPWPFTAAIQDLGTYTRWLKALLTLASGLCLIVGAILA